MDSEEYLLAVRVMISCSIVCVFTLICQ